MRSHFLLKIIRFRDLAERQHRVVRLRDAARVDWRDVSSSEVVQVVDGEVIAADLVRIFSRHRWNFFRSSVVSDSTSRHALHRSVELRFLTGKLKLLLMSGVVVVAVRGREVVADGVGGERGCEVVFLTSGPGSCGIRVDV